eukprot:9470159-Pyramimonas_sp.AAC.1
MNASVYCPQPPTFAPVHGSGRVESVNLKRVESRVHIQFNTYINLARSTHNRLRTWILRLLYN